mmetsp:Transcript_6874/g.10643  ORF Transcript_6874/g.10643 Transcript_6874/m.10643 type:complete len:107 (-) Transcript_6874:1054-1374(-)
MPGGHLSDNGARGDKLPSSINLTLWLVAVFNCVGLRRVGDSSVRLEVFDDFLRRLLRRIFLKDFETDVRKEVKDSLALFSAPGCLKMEGKKPLFSSSLGNACASSS